jgi:hypothetical protein
MSMYTRMASSSAAGFEPRTAHLTPRSKLQNSHGYASQMCRSAGEEHAVHPLGAHLHHVGPRCLEHSLGQA